MRILFCIFLFLIIFVSAYAQDNVVSTMLEGKKLNGQVRQLIEKSFKDSDTIKNIFEITYLFDNNGLLIEQEAPEHRIIKCYNDNQQLEKSSTYYTKGNLSGRLSGYIDFYYDQQGNLIKRVLNFPASDSIVTHYFDYFSTIYIYSDEGNLIEKKEIQKRRDQKKESIYDHHRYVYDSLGNRIKEEQLSGAKVTERKENKYINGRLIETFTWQLFEEEDLYLRDLYEYNVDGTLNRHINIVYYYGGTDNIGNISEDKYLYKYDVENRLVEESIRTSHEVMGEQYEHYVVYKYDDFDAYNNWRRRVTEKNDVGNITVRLFDYYE